MPLNTDFNYSGNPFPYSLLPFWIAVSFSPDPRVDGTTPAQLDLVSRAIEKELPLPLIRLPPIRGTAVAAAATVDLRVAARLSPSPPSPSSPSRTPQGRRRDLISASLLSVALMSYKLSTRDRLNRVAPQLRPAGVHGDDSEVKTAELLSTYNPDGLRTPDHIRSFQHRGCAVDEASRHWGYAKDPKRDPTVRYGVRGNRSGGMEECLRPALYADKATTLIEAQREARYRSNVLKPLGHGPAPRDPIPVPFSGFGVTQPKGESVASTLSGFRNVDVLHPAEEQLSRGYDWSRHGIDPVQHRFGVKTEGRNGSTSALLEMPPTTLLSSKLYSDYKKTVSDDPTRPKSYGFDNPADWDAKKRGFTTVKGATGTAASHFQTEQPSIRELLSTWAEAPAPAAPPPEKVDAKGVTLTGSSLPNFSSGGSLKSKTLRGYEDLSDEARVPQLLYPCHYVSLGVASKYFAGGRSLENVRELCHKCDFGLSDAQIDSLFAELNTDGACGIEEFKNHARAKGLM